MMQQHRMLIIKGAIPDGNGIDEVEAKIELGTAAWHLWLPLLRAQLARQQHQA